jgi:dihydroorotate dehydrogenase electron transfer subunit
MDAPRAPAAQEADPSAAPVPVEGASPRRLYAAVVESNEECSPGYRLVRYRLDAPVRFRAGQFAMLRGDWGADPLLGRPMSILRLAGAAGGGALGAGRDAGLAAPGAAADRADFLLKVVGKGTQALADARPGTRATLLAPLGRPFRDEEDAARRVLLVGGGVGVPPVYALARERAAAGRAATTTLLLGGRTAADVFPALSAEIAALGVEVVVATEDGSQGAAGRVTAPLAPRLNAAAAAPAGATVYACGPDGMLRALAALCAGAAAEHGAARVRYWAAVEQLMACGFGACLGCVLPLADGRRKLVCTDGPVLDGREVYG